jgi:hypothetical protein
VEVLKRRLHLASGRGGQIVRKVLWLMAIGRDSEREGRVRRNSAKIIMNGMPARWLGANFWSRTGGPLMWRSYDPAIVRDALALRRAGIRGVPRVLRQRSAGLPCG